MVTPRRFWYVLFGSILGLALIACSCFSNLPITSKATPTSQPIATLPPVTQPPATQPPASALPLLAGNWQSGSKVFVIELQDGKFVVTAINSADSSTRTLNSQNWDGQSLTWTYTYSDEWGDKMITITTFSVDGDNLTVNYSTDGSSPSVETMRRIDSTEPVAYPLPYTDSFDNPDSGWSIYDTDKDSAGYQDGYYYVISKTTDYSSYGSAGVFFDNLVLEVDVTAISGSGNDLSFNIGCRVQPNSDGYLFEVDPGGNYAVGYYTGGGKDYTSLLSGTPWQFSDAVIQGFKTNHVKVTCNGTQLSMELNGKPVFNGEDGTFSAGDISLGAATYANDNTPAEYHFDNLSVTAP